MQIKKMPTQQLAVGRENGLRKLWPSQPSVLPQGEVMVGRKCHQPPNTRENGINYTHSQPGVQGRENQRHESEATDTQYKGVVEKGEGGGGAYHCREMKDDG